MPNVRVLNNQKLEFFKENRVVPHAMINVDDNGLLVSSHMQVGGNLRVNGSIEATILKGELPAHTHNVADIIGGADQQNTFSSIALYNSEGLPVPNSPYFALTPNDTITLKASGNISFVMESNGEVTIDDTHYHDPDDISGIDAWIESNPTVVSNTNSRHNHSNKALLDSYTQTEASLADAVNKKHDRTHGLLSADHLVVGLTAGHILMATGSTTVEFKALEASHIPNLDWSKITTGKPTTLSGYGITDSYTKSDLQTSGHALVHWDNLTNVPELNVGPHTHLISEVTGLQDALDGKQPINQDLTDIAAISPLEGHFLRRAASGWTSGTILAADIPGLDWTKIVSNKPTTLLGYGITDAYTKIESDSLFASIDHEHDDRYPLLATTLGGYGITDAYTKVEADGKFGLLANAVIETGSNENGTWRKWADGTLECWGTKTFTSVAVTNYWGGGIYISPTENVIWPIRFGIVESVNINVIARTPQNFVPLSVEAAEPYLGLFYFWKPGSATYDSITVGFYVKGRWK